MTKGTGKRPLQPATCPAGVRADGLKAHNVPVPNTHSVWEEFRWREEHIQ